MDIETENRCCCIVVLVLFIKNSFTCFFVVR